MTSGRLSRALDRREVALVALSLGHEKVPLSCVLPVMWLTEQLLNVGLLFWEKTRNDGLNIPQWMPCLLKPSKTIRCLTAFQRGTLLLTSPTVSL